MTCKILNIPKIAKLLRESNSDMEADFIKEINKN